MSEFPFGGDPGETPAPLVEADNGAPGRQPSKRVLLLGGAAVAGLAVAGGLFLLSGSGGGSSTQAFTPTSHPKPHVSASATPAKKPAATLAPVAAYSGKPLGRDPFKPLVTPTTAATSGATGAATGTAPTTPVTVPAPASPSTPAGGTGGTGGTGSTTPPTAPGSGLPSPSQPPRASYTLVLNGVTGSAGRYLVQFSWRGTPYRLAVGQTTRDGMVKVLAVRASDNDVSFQVGDQLYDLHPNQHVLLG